MNNEATKIMSYDKERKVLFSEILNIKVVSPDRDRKYYKLKKSKILFGSSDDCHVVVGDEYVSKIHCKLNVDETGIILTDLGSTNGTLYEKERIQKITLPETAKFTIGKSDIIISRAAEKERIAPAKEIKLGSMIGTTNEMKEIFSLIKKVAPTDATVFITGESGTGKELVAKSIHEESKKERNPFVAINCGAIPTNIIESELFGHEKGAFTGASQTHHGVFEQAHTGTLFLDEVGEMPLDLQTRLLRVLETKTVRRIGGQRDIKVDVRIIAATNQDPKKNVIEGKFREDLFFRLYIIPVHLPPLRDRKNDIEMLAKHFLKLFSPDDDKALSRSAVRLLTSHSWPGNVRELRNTIQRAVIMNRNGIISAHDIRLTEIIDSKDFRSLPLFTQEKEAVLDALRKSNGNQSKAAEILGIARTTLASKVRKYDIDVGLIRL